MTNLQQRSLQPRRIELSQIRTVLLDFDGPICELFSDVRNYTVADRLRQILFNNAVTLPPELMTTVDPFDLFRATELLSTTHTTLVEAALAEAEYSAACSCRSTPHATDLIFACKRSLRNVAIVSNTAASAIERYLYDHELDHHIDVVVGRVEPHPSLLKPNPHLVRKAITALGAAPATCVLIGDQVSDIEAAHNAGTWAIGYANKPGKTLKLEAAGADAIITELSALAAQFMRTPAEWPPRD